MLVPRCSIFRAAVEIAVMGIVFLCNSEPGGMGDDAIEINVADFLHDKSAQKSTNVGVDITFCARGFA